MHIDNAVLREVFGAASLAPSGDNSQPWRVVVRGRVAQVFTEPERADFFVNLTGHATWLGLGAFAEAARLAAAPHGLGVAVELADEVASGTPSQTVGRPLCRLSFNDDPRAAEPTLVSALAERRCNRARYDKTPLTEHERLSLLQDEFLAPARLWLSATKDELRELARVVGEAEKLRAGIRQAHEDLQRWLRWTPEEAERTRDGLDVRTLALKPHEQLGLRILRSWRVMGIAAKLGARAMQGAYMRELMQKSAAVVAILAPRNDPRALVAAGSAMLRVWLRATSLGLAVSPAIALPLLAAASESDSSPIEAPIRTQLLGLRQTLDAVCGARPGETVSLLLRVGHAPPPVRSLRRPLEDWFSIEEDVGARRD